jgi:hypothetical protein
VAPDSCARGVGEGRVLAERGGDHGAEEVYEEGEAEGPQTQDGGSAETAQEEATEEEAPTDAGSQGRAVRWDLCRRPDRGPDFGPADALAKVRRPRRARDTPEGTARRIRHALPLSWYVGVRLRDHVTISLLLPGRAVGQPTGATLAGEWSGAPAKVTITQDGARVSGAWQEPWSERELSCSGTWFEGTNKGQSITGTRYLCSRAPRPLELKIVDADTLEITLQVPGGTTRAMTLRRIK